MSELSVFHYTPDILANYPNLSGGVLLAGNLTNAPASPALQEQYAAEQAAVKARIGNTPLSELPSLAGWRAAFRAFGVDPTQYRSAAESLLRRLTKKGDIPSINTLVDIGNLVSIRYALPVAIIDRAAITGAITVHVADGTERFTNLNAEQPDPPKVGEVVFTDESGLGIARRWCWRQSEESAARESTTDVLITVEAQHPGGRADVENALADLGRLLVAFAGVEQQAVQTAMLR